MKILTNRQFLKSLAFFKNPFPSYVYILQNQGNYLSNVYVERNISWSVLKHSLQGLPEQRAEILLVLEINKSLVRGHVNIYTSSQGLYVDEYEGKLIPVIVVVYLETHKYFKIIRDESKIKNRGFLLHIYELLSRFFTTYISENLDLHKDA